jgi:hypothetical protein
MLSYKMVLMLVDEALTGEMAKSLWVSLVDHIHPRFVVGLGHYSTSREQWWGVNADGKLNSIE